MSAVGTVIVDFDERLHLHGVQQCVIELQDFERSYESRMPTGAEIVDEYIPLMLQRCRQCDGKVLVALVDNVVAAYATILTRVQSDEIGDGDSEFGLVPDLVVLPQFRDQGLGRKLLEAAESYATDCNVKWLRIGVLAANQVAGELYLSAGFSPLYVEYEKELGAAAQR